MSDWTSGYVADINYTHGFYRELTPTILRMVSLIKGMHGPETGEPLNYCELGCGQGFSANLLAAANPHIQYHAMDFNPAHIVGALALAREAGLPNVNFYDDSFIEFLGRGDLPQFDVIALHGIYSWVAAEHRQTIVEFISRRLKPGGIVYVSYNAMPGWAAAAPMRHLMYLHGKAQGGPTISRIDPGLAFIEKVMAADAKFFQTSPTLKARHEQLTKHNRSYLAHEYFNDSWTLLYHSDVAAEMSEAKLGYLGSAHLLDHVDAVNLTADQKAIVDGVVDPVLRETVRDYIVNQQFRRDIFAKGTLPVSPMRSRETWLDSRFALSLRREDAVLKARGALGEADLHADVYTPLLDALAAGPATVREMTAHAPVAALGWPRLFEAMIILTGSGQMQPCLPAEGDAERAKTTRAFNDAVIRRARDNADLQFLASPVTGGGVTVARFAQLFLLAAQEGHETPESWARFAHQVLQAQGQLILKDGAPLQSPEENLAELTTQAEAFAEKQLPVLKALLIA